MGTEGVHSVYRGGTEGLHRWYRGGTECRGTEGAHRGHIMGTNGVTKGVEWGYKRDGLAIMLATDVNHSHALPAVPTHPRCSGAS